MEREKIKTLLKILKIENIRDRGNWVSASCPFAKFVGEHDDRYDGNPSFGVSVGEISKFNCFTCGRRGKLSTLPTILSFLNHQDYIEARDFISKYENQKNKSDRIKYVLDAISEDILDRFQDFGKGNLGPITNESIRLWNLKYDVIENRLIFPIYDSFGRLVGIRGRYLGDNKDVPKYMTYKIQPKIEAKAAGIWYGMHFELIPNKKLVLVEGERDAILLKQSGIRNVWASMGIPPSKAQYETLTNIDMDLSVILYTDNDNAGEKARLDMYKNLRGIFPLFRIDNYYNTKDAAEAVEKGIIYKVLKTAVQCG